MAKGIILAGGTGTRLWPLTATTNKHLLPVYDKPMVYYPLTTLMLAGVRDILLITNPQDIYAFRTLLGNGSRWGICIDYAPQAKADGIATAFVIARHFIGTERCVLILGDNVFYGAELGGMLATAIEGQDSAMIFCQRVRDPSRYGVVSFDDDRPTDIKEKPKHPDSDWAVTGLYVYDHSVCDAVTGIAPSARGELEITDLNRVYLDNGRLTARKLGRGFAWFDAGTPQSLLQVSEFIYTLQERQGLRIGWPDEVAVEKGFLNAQLGISAASICGA